MADLRELDQDERNAILHRMVEGLHALIFGTYTIGSGDYALRALGDGGSIHEYVHGMLWLLPERCYEQVKTSDMDTQALARREFAHAVAPGVTVVGGTLAPKPPCTVCGTPYERHGSYPTCSSHPYTADGKCQHVGTLVGSVFSGAPCAGAECKNGCVRALGVARPDHQSPAPTHADGGPGR